ncbi:Patronin (microtubule-binding protein) homolog, partial [Geodia barretti]
MSTEDTRRLLCSLAWLRGLGGNGKLLGDVKFLIDDKVTQEVAAVLANPTCYMKAFRSIFPFNTLEEEADGTFWPLIHVLACRGVYVVNEGQSVNHAILSQTKPFEVSTHLALIDALMRAYVLAVVKIPHVMRVVRYVCN